MSTVRTFPAVLLSLSLMSLGPLSAAEVEPDSAPSLKFAVREGLNLNSFVRSGKVAAHLLLRSGANPRVIVAFPAGNSGVGLWFAHLPQDANWDLPASPEPVVLPDPSGRSLYGLRFEARISTPELQIERAILSSVRVLRDYQSLGKLPDLVVTAPQIHGQSVSWARDRLDGAAGYLLNVEIVDGVLQESRIRAGADGRIALRITAASGETPLTPLAGSQLLDSTAAADSAARNTLTFLSYQEKFLAGSWRFNTYFGRDTLMSVRLLMPALNAPAVEAGLSAVLARLSPLGEVAHEEDIGEFAILDHLRTDGTRSDAPVYDYKMIDGNFILAPVARAWLLEDARARPRAPAFLAGSDGRYGGQARRRGEDLVANLRFVCRAAVAFARDPQFANLIRVKAGLTLGNWRDSDEGIGRGPYPYDVNAVLVPAALEAAHRLYASGLLDRYLGAGDRALFVQARRYAEDWRRRAPPLFEVRVPRDRASTAVAAYARTVGVPYQPAANAAGADGARFHGISLDEAGVPVPIVNSDEGFALLFGEPDAANLELAVSSLMQPYPEGLMTEVGMLVANPAYAPPAVQLRFSRNAYHGAVVWSWQQAMFAAGLERQLRRSDLPAGIRQRLVSVQQELWTAIDAGSALNNSELWSWSFTDGHYHIAPFGAAGADVDESNAAQLWSSVYLAVRPPRGRH